LAKLKTAEIPIEPQQNITFHDHDHNKAFNNSTQTNKNMNVNNTRDQRAVAREGEKDRDYKVYQRQARMERRGARVEETMVDVPPAEDDAAVQAQAQAQAEAAAQAQAEAAAQAAAQAQAQAEAAAAAQAQAQAEAQAQAQLIASFQAEDARVRAAQAAQGRALARMMDHNSRGAKEGWTMLTDGDRVFGSIGTATNARNAHHHAVNRHQELTH
jgi:membrane protein involved in colicin uptake